jgi:N-acetyl-gamma-glutamylphosphate reductase
MREANYYACLQTTPILRLLQLPHIHMQRDQIASVHPQLQSYGNKKFNAFNAADFASCDLVFLALPHGESAKIVGELPTSSKIVDLGADYRLESADAWSAYYGGEYAGAWTYGLADIEPFQIRYSKVLQGCKSWLLCNLHHTGRGTSFRYRRLQ